MTSTTPSVFPAATRAGESAFSPDSGASRSTDEAASETRFEDLCPEGYAAPKEGTEAHGPSDATEELKPAADAPASEEAAPEEKDEEAARRRATEAAAIVLPNILATLREVAPAIPAAIQPAAGPAENADSAEATDGVPGSRTASAATEASAAAAQLAATHRPRRGDRTGRTTTEDAATAKPATPTSVPLQRTSRNDTVNAETTSTSVASRAKTITGASAEETSAASAVPRTGSPRVHGEKTAALAVGLAAARVASGENKFLNTDNQDVALQPRVAGTRSALSAGTMPSSTTTTQRHAEGPSVAATSEATSTMGGWADGLSVDWKGWTNGGGERASTAAQFSQLGDKLGHAAIAAAPASSSAGRPVTTGAAPVAPTTAQPAVPTAEALAPIHSAIERLVVHGRDQIALTVRFEQGGSLSIRLAMNDGAIATQIQTDVPGLEAALKASWGELAQDWNGRGWKLANPEFSTGSASYHRNDDATAGGRESGRQAGRDADESPAFAGRAFAPARLKHAGAVALSGPEAVRAAARARRGIHTWA